MVAVLGDLGEEAGHPRLGPVPAHDGQHVAEDVRLGDGAVDVADDDLVRVLPPVDVALAAGRALEGRRHRELSLVGSRNQVHLFLKTNKEGMVQLNEEMSFGGNLTQEKRMKKKYLARK